MAEQATEAPTPGEGEDQLQSTQAPSQETSAAPETTEAPDYFGENFDPSTLDEALQPAYKQLRGDYTRKTQELAEQRKQAESVQAAFTDLQSEDPETSQGALNWLTQTGLLNENTLQKVLPAFGYEFDDQTDDTGDDEPAYLTHQEYEQRRAAEQAEAAENEYVEQVDRHLQSQIEEINAELKEQGLDELDEEDQRGFVISALQAAPPKGMPDVRAVFDRYQKRLEARMDGRLKGWADTKKGGATRPGGAAATGVPDLDNMTGDERRAWQAQRLRELDEQAGP